MRLQVLKLLHGLLHFVHVSSGARGWGWVPTASMKSLTMRYSGALLRPERSNWSNRHSRKSRAPTLLESKVWMTLDTRSKVAGESFPVVSVRSQSWTSLSICLRPLLVTCSILLGLEITTTAYISVSYPSAGKSPIRRPPSGDHQRSDERWK